MSRRFEEGLSFSYSSSSGSSSIDLNAVENKGAAFAPLKETVLRSLVSRIPFRSCHTFSVKDLDDDREEFLQHSPQNSLLDMDKIRIGPQFASGGSGNLYHGIYNGQAVAVKLFHESNERFQEELNSVQFLQEVAALSVLKNQYILQFIGAFWEGRVKGLVTEFMSGGNVHNFLRKIDRRLPYKQILKMALDIAHGMSYLHSQKIIHRDLKSENLLLDSTGNVKIMDFGISKFARPGADANMTAETGTYRWMAPEVILGTNYTQAVDVYSYGIVIWELWTRERPFEGLTPVQAVFSVVHKNLRPTIPADCPEEYSRLIEDCWQKDGAARPTFPEIAQQLIAMQAKSVSIP